MKSFKPLFFMLLCAAGISCQDKEPKEIAVTGFSLNETSIEVRVESTFELVAIITPEDATNKNVTWKSYNEEVATVDENGVVTGISVGNTTVAATCEATGAMKQVVVSVIPKYDYTDLGASETANCYIIEEAGHYKFAAVKGNGFESVGRISRAALLWETCGTKDTFEVGTILNPEMSILNDCILFSTPDKLVPGNAVIAAYDNADNILWSWHIWVPEGKIEGKKYVGGAGVAMDRNLGATTATPGLGTSNGFIYQWGRKDPFPGGPDLGSNSLTTFTTGEWPETLDMINGNSSKCTIEYTIAHPMQRIGKITSTFANMDWLYTEDGVADGTRWMVDYKTIYDPCPAGWRVPNRQGGVDPHFAAMENGTPMTTGNGLSLDAEKGCLVVGTDYCINGPDYYPLVLYTNNGISANKPESVTGVAYWSAFSQGTNNVMGSCWQLASGKWYPKGTINKFYYLPIRCCKADDLM